MFRPLLRSLLRSLLLSIAFFFSFSAMAQSRLWSYGLQVNGIYSERWDYRVGEGISSPNENYRYYGFWGAGAHLSYRLNKRLLLEVGLAYQGRSRALKWDFTFPSNIDPYYGFVQETAESGYDIGLRITEHYAEVPLRLHYFFEDVEQGWHADLGLMPSLYVARTAWDYAAGGRRTTLVVGQAQRPTELYLYLQAGGGYRFPITERLRLDLGLFAQHTLIPRTVWMDFREFHWGVGLETSLQVKL